MKDDSSATAPDRGAVPAAGGRGTGVGWGAVGVLAFSLTLPATRAALPAFGATTVGLGRAVPAALLAGLCLLVARVHARTTAAPDLPVRPRGDQWPRLLLVSGGVVVGFPLFSALALRQVGAGHAAVLVGLLPAGTAVVAAVRGKERPPRAFWIAVIAGVLAVLVFAAVTGAGRPQVADLLLVLAVLAAAIGYAEGGLLAREMSGWRVIAWALLIAQPVLLPVTLLAVAHHLPHHPSTTAYLGLGYVAVVSMFLGFVAWYRGLATGGIARIGQLQLAQPVLTLGWAWLLLSEHVGAKELLAAVAVLAATVLSQRVRRDARSGPGRGGYTAPAGSRQQGRTS